MTAGMASAIVVACIKATRIAGQGTVTQISPNLTLRMKPGNLYVLLLSIGEAL
jgi:hypothetical protein